MGPSRDARLGEACARAVPTSGVGAAMTAWALVAEVIEKLLARGITPTVYASANLDWGQEFNDRAKHGFDERHLRRVRHVIRSVFEAAREALDRLEAHSEQSVNEAAEILVEAIRSGRTLYSFASHSFILTEEVVYRTGGSHAHQSRDASRNGHGCGRYG